MLMKALAPKFIFVILLALVVAYGTDARSAAGETGRLIVFGDSWSDTGNERRFTDGLVWHEYLASELRIDVATPSFNGGTNHGIGGLRVANPNAEASDDRRSFRVRVDEFLRTTSPTEEDIIFVWAGTPDFVVDFLLDAELVANGIAEQVTRMAEAGGTNFVLGNVPMLGQTPRILAAESISPGASMIGDELALEFDAKIRDLANSLSADLNINVGIMDVLQLHQSVLDSPCQPFCSPREEGGDLFSDQIHFRTEFHQMVAEPAKVGIGFPEASRIVGGWKSVGRDTNWDDISVTAAGTPTQSSDRNASSVAANAVDGDLGTTARTSDEFNQHSWQLDFSAATPIRGFSIRNGRNGDRILGLTDDGGMRAEVLDADGEVVWQQDFIETPIPGGRLEYRIPEDVEIGGHTFRIRKLNPVESEFNIAEVDVISDLPTYVMSPDETWVFELDADTNQSDSIGFQNDLDINGSRLHVELLTGELADGDTFDLFDADAVIGSFSELRLPTPASGLRWDTDNLTVDGTIRVDRLVVMSADFDENGILDSKDIDQLSDAIGTSGHQIYDLNGDGTVSLLDHSAWLDLAAVTPGDTNFDGKVNFVDFLNLSANFDVTGGWGEGDFDGSGNVDFDDFLVVSQNFGLTGLNAASVPEPSAVLLMVTAILGSLKFRQLLRNRNR